MAHAIKKSRHFALGGFFDVDTKRVQAAERKWSCPASPRERRAWINAGWDVIYISSPDHCHITDLKDAMNAEPKAIIVEKPLSLNAIDGQSVIKRARKKNIPVVVNFPRRWHSGVEKIKRLHLSKTLAQPLRTHIVCSGGMIHNGVHALDLFYEIWGDRKIPFQMTEMPAENYYVFEMTVYGRSGILNLAGSPEKLTISARMPDSLYAGFTSCRPVMTAEIDREPLLLQALTFTAGLIGNKKATNDHLARELAGQIFINKVLTSLNAYKKGK
jgi:predicted dehydrogenase